MRKILVFSAVLAALAASASAEILEFRPYAGYTTVNMAEVNGDIQGFRDTLKAFAIFSSGPYSESNDKLLGDGFVVGGDFSNKNLLPWKSLSLDLRGEYLQTNQSEYKSDSVPVGPIHADLTTQGTLSSALLGLFWQPCDEGGSVDMSAGAFVGVGYGTMERSIDFGGGPVGDLYTRLGAVGQLESRINWHLPHSLTLSGNCGYRIASLGQFYDSKNHPMSNTFSDSGFPIGGYGLVVDFSGFTATGALSYAF